MDDDAPKVHAGAPFLTAIRFLCPHPGCRGEVGRFDGHGTTLRVCAWCRSVWTEDEWDEARRLRRERATATWGNTFTPKEASPA